MTKISELPPGQGVGRAAWYRRQAHTTITAADYTLVAGDDGKVLVMERETVQNVTVPPGLPVGFSCVIIQGGAATTADRLVIDRVIGESELRAQHKVSAACWGGGPGSVITITRLTSTVYAVGGGLYLTEDGAGEIAAALAGKADIGQAQPIARWSYADTTARDAATYVSGDIGYVARVASPLGFWRLAAVSPALSWEQIGRVYAPVPSAITGATHDLAAGDVGRWLRFTTSGAKTVNVLTSTDVVDGEWYIRNASSSGSITLVAGSGVTLAEPESGGLVIPIRGSRVIKRIAPNSYEVA